MQITTFERDSPSLVRKNKTENGEWNRDGEWNFCREKEADIALLSQVTKIRKIIKILEAN